MLPVSSIFHGRKSLVPNRAKAINVKAAAPEDEAPEDEAPEDEAPEDEADEERLQIVAEILAHIITEAGQGGDGTE